MWWLDSYTISLFSLLSLSLSLPFLVLDILSMLLALVVFSWPVNTTQSGPVVVLVLNMCKCYEMRRRIVCECAGMGCVISLFQRGS